jgi:hypothetical protein
MRMSICPGIFQMRTLYYGVHLHYPCNSACIYTQRLRLYMLYCDVGNLVTVTKTNMIDEMPGCCGILRITPERIWHHVSHRACTEVSAAFKVVGRLFQMSQLLLKSLAYLHRGLSCLKQSSATTLVSVWNTRVFRTALMALTEPRTLCRRITRCLSPRRRVALHSTAPGSASDKPVSVWEHLETQ